MFRNYSFFARFFVSSFISSLDLVDYCDLSSGSAREGGREGSERGMVKNIILRAVRVKHVDCCASSFLSEILGRWDGFLAAVGLC